jgi:NAD-dependent SIR2 family protein deacetylase
MLSQDSGNKAEKPASQDQVKGKQNWQACTRCDQRFLPPKMVKRMQKKFPENADLLAMCPSCRRKKAAEDMVLAEGAVKQNT